MLGDTDFLPKKYQHMGFTCTNNYFFSSFPIAAEARTCQSTKMRDLTERKVFREVELEKEIECFIISLLSSESTSIT